MWNPFRRTKAYRVLAAAPPPRLVITEPCYAGMLHCLSSFNSKGHEGVSYLLGQTNGSVSVAIHSARPRAITTRGSFHVPPREMARVVGLATQYDLQVIAQVHTHPGEAYHSDGDVDGAKIMFEGFFSLVIPDYGAALPQLTGAAAFIFTGQGWEPVPLSAITLLRGHTIL